MDSSALLIVSVMVKKYKRAARAKEGHKPWTHIELGGQTAWEWLKLLIAPIFIALATAGFTLVFTHQLTQQQGEEERAFQQLIEAQRAQFSVFQAYLDHMETLLLDRRLRTSKQDSNVRKVAQARTLSTLDTLSPERKVWVLEFLFETELIQADSPKQEPIISLKFANLREVYLVKRRILKSADLEQASLERAKLRGADLSGADLSGADLSNADLRLADLSDADLSDADLLRAPLKGANLSHANLKGVIGTTNEELEHRAGSLEGAIMIDGSKHP